MELGIPVIMAINMMDLVRKSGDQINVDKLSKKLGCPVVEISALKGDGIKEAANKAVELAKKFGGNDSPAFINGVLARLVKEQAN